MSAGMKGALAGFAKNRIQRYLVRVGIGVVLVGGSVAYRSIGGVPDLAGSPVRRSAVARHIAHDTARVVELQASAAPVPTHVAAAPAAGEPQFGIPDINAPKRAAQRAADATNANISEQTGQALPAPRGSAPAGPVAAQPRSGPASVPAVPVAGATPAAGAAVVPPVTREVYTYSAEGRRDPFYSLILTEDLRPLLSDLKLVGILYEPSGKRSVAIMRDVLTNAQYRVIPGQTLGRMRVMQIKQKGVIFSIDEFGLSRQDSLVLTDTTKVRN